MTASILSNGRTHGAFGGAGGGAGAVGETLVERSDGQVQVLQGLAAGDEVVVYSHKALSPDSRVQVVDTLVKADKAGGAP